MNIGGFYVEDYPIAVSQAAAVLVNLVVFRLTHQNFSEVEMFSAAIVIQAVFAVVAQRFTHSRTWLEREHDITD